MNLAPINNAIDRIRARTFTFFSRGKTWRRRITLFLAVIGPGIITSNVDNDAGGIATYTQAGSAYGYTLLWSLIPMTIALYVTEEMCARMGVITGKGLSDLIREEFGFRSTFFVMVTGFLVDLGQRRRRIRRRSRSMEIFGISKYIAVPLAAVFVWTLGAERHLPPGGSYLSHRLRLLSHLSLLRTLVAARLAARRPHDRRAQHPFRYRLSAHPYRACWHHHRSLAIFLSAGRLRREKSQPAPISASAAGRPLRQHQLHDHRFLHHHLHRCYAPPVSGLTNITDAAEAAKALIPLAGKWAGILFAFGLLNASLFAATILPLSTAHVICEGLGFEAGIDHKFREAPAFYWLYTILILVGAGIVLIPNAPSGKFSSFRRSATASGSPS